MRGNLIDFGNRVIENGIIRRGGFRVDQQISEAILGSRVIAVVGLSDKTERPSYRVAQYMREKGFRIIPVNPNVDEVLGEKAFPDLTSIPEKIDMVNVFRRSEDILPIAEHALKINPKFFWMQEGIENQEAKNLLEGHGITVIMNRCIMKEHVRLV